MFDTMPEDVNSPIPHIPSRAYKYARDMVLKGHGIYGPVEVNPKQKTIISHFVKAFW